MVDAVVVNVVVVGSTVVVVAIVVVVDIAVVDCSSVVVVCDATRPAVPVSCCTSLPAANILYHDFKKKRSLLR